VSLVRRVRSLVRQQGHAAPVVGSVAAVVTGRSVNVGILVSPGIILVGTDRPPGSPWKRM